jgi:hypothetical protein
MGEWASTLAAGGALCRVMSPRRGRRYIGLDLPNRAQRPPFRLAARRGCGTREADAQVAIDLPAQETTTMANAHELRFDHLSKTGRAFVFPCDDKGRVDLDSLSLLARNNYFFARTLVGRDVSAPRVECRELDAARLG